MKSTNASLVTGFVFFTVHTFVFLFLNLTLKSCPNCLLSGYKESDILTEQIRVVKIFFSPSGPGSGSGFVPGPGLRRGGGGEAQDVAHALLLEALQRPRPSPAICQHGLRLQGQPGHLPAGKNRRSCCCSCCTPTCERCRNLTHFKRTAATKRFKIRKHFSAKMNW